jgi:CheY-like chemotaxis protein
VRVLPQPRGGIRGLPDIDGYEVGRTLRAQLGPEVQVVALTGYGQDVDRRRSAEAGFDGHQVNPVHPEEIARLLAA